MASENNITAEQAKNFLSGAEMEISTYKEANTEKAKKLSCQIQDWFFEEREEQAENRLEQAIDCGFYDGDQWTEEEKQELVDRGQAPLVVNLIKQTINWLTGTEKRTRIDWTVKGTQKDGGEDAQNKTKLIKYIQTVNRGSFKRSQAFSHACKAGLGWREFGVRGDLTDEPIYIAHESWRNIWHDSKATDPMFIDDGRYIFRRKVVDLDIALAMLPQRADELIAAATNYQNNYFDDVSTDVQLYYQPNKLSSSISDAIHGRRAVVALVECWYRKPVTSKYIKNSDHFDRGTEYDAENEDMISDLENAQTDSTLYDKVEMKMFVCMFIDAGNNKHGTFLYNCKSPYKHNRFPFVPVWAYRNDSDGTPYGPVRGQRDPQVDFNKRHSKSQFILASRGVTYESGAIEPEDEDDVLEELARPDFFIKYKKGHKFDIHQDNNLASEHVQIAKLDEQYIRQSSGVTGENMGLETNANSGIAMRERKEEGGVVTQDLFDNLRMHDQVSGEIILSLIEQFMDIPFQFSVTGESGDEFVEINQPSEDGRSIVNDISERTAKFIVTEQDFRATTRQAMFEQLMSMLSSMDTEIALQLLDAVIDMSDIPERKEIIRRIRQINGQQDPDDIDEDQLKQAEEAKAVARQEAEKMNTRKVLSEVENTEANTNLVNANAGNITAESLIKALEAASLMVVAKPQEVQIADAIVEEGKAGEQQDEENLQLTHP